MHLVRASFPCVFALSCSTAGSAPTPSPQLDNCDQPYVSRTAPSRPVAPGKLTPARWFAVDDILLGGRAADRSADPNAWQSLGLNLDGRNTTEAQSENSRFSCHRPSGSPWSVLADACGGIDNQFGKYLLKAFKYYRNDLEDALTGAIASGKVTLILRIEGIPSDEIDSSSAPGAVYWTTALGAKPTFSDSDHWPIAAESLSDGSSIDAPRISFPKGYITAGRWVSGDPPTGTLLVPLMKIDSFDLSLPLESPRIIVGLNGTGGTLAGIMKISRSSEIVVPIARALCVAEHSDTVTPLEGVLAGSADLVASGIDLQDTNRGCDAISVGLGFTMKPTGVPGTIAATASAPTPDCAPDAGAETGD